MSKHRQNHVNLLALLSAKPLADIEKEVQSWTEKQANHIFLSSSIQKTPQVWFLLLPRISSSHAGIALKQEVSKKTSSPDALVGLSPKVCPADLSGALDCATKFGNLDAVKFLISQTSVNPSHPKYLLNAVLQEDLAMVNFFLHASPISALKNQALHAAVSTGNMDILRTLLPHFPLVGQNRFLLSDAALSGKWHIVDHLLSVPDWDKWSPLSFCIRQDKSVGDELAHRCPRALQEMALTWASDNLGLTLPKTAAAWSRSGLTSGVNQEIKSSLTPTDTLLSTIRKKM